MGEESGFWREEGRWVWPRDEREEVRKIRIGGGMVRSGLCVFVGRGERERLYIVWRDCFVDVYGVK